MGIARLDSPDAPFTFAFPDTRNPSLIHEPLLRQSQSCWQRISPAALSLTVSMVAKRDDSHEATSQAQRRLGSVLVNDICASRGFRTPVVARFWGAHAARVQVSVASPKPSDSGSNGVGLKVRDREDAIACTRA